MIINEIYIFFSLQKQWWKSVENSQAALYMSPDLNWQNKQTNKLVYVYHFPMLLPVWITTFITVTTKNTVVLQKENVGTLNDILSIAV